MIYDDDKLRIYYYMLHKKIHFDYILLEFNKKNEIYVIKKLLCFTSNFMLIKSDRAVLLHDLDIKRFRCVENNTDKILNAIFNGDKFKCSDAGNSKNDRYVLLAIGKNITSQDCIYDKYMLNCYAFENLVEKVEGIYALDSIMVICNRLIPVVSSNPAPPYDVLLWDNDCLNRNTKIMLFPQRGLGDMFIFYSLLSHTIKMCIQKHIDLYFISSTINYSCDILSDLFPEIPFIYADNAFVINFICKKSVEFGLMGLNETINRSGIEINLHVYDVLKSRLDCSNVQPYTYKDELLKRIIDYLPQDEKEYIDSLCHGSVVGLQYFSGTEYKNGNCSSQTSRNWDIKNVITFAKLCKSGDLKLILLNENPYDENIDAIQLKKVSVYGYIYAISKLSINVGIESSSGHISSFFNIPNVTLWGGGSNPYVFQGINFSFRALRNNISIVPTSANINNISPVIVYDTIVNILAGKILPPKNCLKYTCTEGIITV